MPLVLKKILVNDWHEINYNKCVQAGISYYLDYVIATNSQCRIYPQRYTKTFTEQEGSQPYVIIYMEILSLVT